ncbi:hypothetical protein EDE08_106267 [Bradyrhizobium sp. R2.2-H]|jgi:hypothetical protein|nr:hypothetical protein EDE10_106139 [Bradyrhizobium sp. Y-H1]TCU73207.1 hypothetical protein EDE08_106267 [Bradyrhizobium sp. R2.2-H]
MRAQAEFLHGLGQKRPGQGVVVKGRDGPKTDIPHTSESFESAVNVR